MRAIRSRRPPYAPEGNPPPRIFDSVVRSGRTPYSSCAPPAATRKPVITSSKISSAPLASHTRRSVSRKPRRGGTTPMFAATGSTITHAISWPRWAKNFSTAGASL